MYRKVQCGRPGDRVGACNLNPPVVAEAGENQPFLGIPVSAVRKSNGRQTVFRVDHGSVYETEIQTGKQWDDTLQAISGLKEGDIVVLRPEKGMRDGSRVRIKE